MRGEYYPTATRLYGAWELPPHARRIPGTRFNTSPLVGTTSACAENTRCVHPSGGGGENYLRMRGEYRRRCSSPCLRLELPPHARRIHPIARGNTWGLRTTSACAENTRQYRDLGRRFRNYLRMRGEYQRTFLPTIIDGELPPHARRIPQVTVSSVTFLGTTSACAENTAAPSSGRPWYWNYLRMRGEYVFLVCLCRVFSELPPHARRIHFIAPIGDVDHGTTSACAENTRSDQ